MDDLTCSMGLPSKLSQACFSTLSLSTTITLLTPHQQPPLSWNHQPETDLTAC